MNPLVGLPHIASCYFSGIDSLIKEYLTPHVFSLQRLQLSESFLYNANEVSFDWNNFLSEPENIMENGYLEDDYNGKFISSKTCELQLFDKENGNNNRIESQFVVKPQPAELEPAVANLFVTKRHGHLPNLLTNALENVINIHQNTHSSSNTTFNDNGIQERKRNRCANCRNYRHNIRTCTNTN
ncbi:12521_t:CDS:2 [Gigaspora rosea]|nr:12521_t:CDS:2 [Gigaspora rosea]